MVEAVRKDFDKSFSESGSGDDPFVLHNLNLFLIDFDHPLSDTIEECFVKFALEAKKNKGVVKMFLKFLEEDNSCKRGSSDS